MHDACCTFHFEINTVISAALIFPIQHGWLFMHYFFLLQVIFCFVTLVMCYCLSCGFLMLIFATKNNL